MCLSLSWKDHLLKRITFWNGSTQACPLWDTCQSCFAHIARNTSNKESTAVLPPHPPPPSLLTAPCRALNTIKSTRHCNLISALGPFIRNEAFDRFLLLMGSDLMNSIYPCHCLWALFDAARHWGGRQVLLNSWSLSKIHISVGSYQTRGTLTSGKHFVTLQKKVVTCLFFSSVSIFEGCMIFLEFGIF